MFNFFWDRVPESWVLTEKASWLFGVSAIVITAATIILSTDAFRRFESPILGGILGVSTALGTFFLWSGMWRFWKLWDPSSRMARRIWFVVLLVGVWHGAILYYVFVYLRLRRAASHENEIRL